MKQFLTFVKKEFHHIFRDHRTMLILLGMPIVEIILFGFAITTEVKNTTVAVLDPSHDIATRHIIEEINANKYFKITEYINNSQDIQQVFRKNKVALVVAFEPNFYQELLHTGKAQVQLIADASDPNTATTITYYATRIINDYQQQLMGQNKVPYQITPNVKLLFNPEMKGAYNFVPGVLGMILMLICAMMTSIAIVREKETGTMEVLLVSPIKPILIILAKMIPYFIISCVNLGTILLLSVYVLGVPVAGSLIGLITVSLLFIIVSLSLGLLVSTVTRTQLAAMLVSGMVFLLPVILLSGMIFPIENMPIWLQRLSDIIPAKWYIQAVKALMIEGLGIMNILREMGILILMTLVFVIISMKKFNVRLD
ncbi:ABC transporter permease [Microbacter margulisiae]|uniref:ABC-2 type transport system permease protein n=1 Tax=Microbacter margulisiae TaxID=1350067 RepID=A0A7W5H357_9PORP|nr:ABC transporter permease [Microbacter margulisiae]MBB3188151.1 ABC-2 type transport system permease protein [Microbacter margulisiae]